MDMIYLDNTVVSARGKQELSAELSAIGAIYRRHKLKELHLVTSRMTHLELAQLIGKNKEKIESVYLQLEKVPFIESGALVGFNSYWDKHGGWSSPMIEEDSLLRAIKGIGLDQNDSHHVMIAARNNCKVFLTLDRRTILRFRDPLTKLLPMQFKLPTEYQSDTAHTPA